MNNNNNPNDSSRSSPMIPPLDEAELRFQMRQMVKDVGYEGSYRALYEIILSAQILIEVMQEELAKEMKNKKGEGR